MYVSVASDCHWAMRPGGTVRRETSGYEVRRPRLPPVLWARWPPQRTTRLPFPPYKQPAVAIVRSRFVYITRGCGSF